MRIVEPKVFLVGETRCISEGIHAYLNEIGASQWRSDGASNDAEGLIELYGRGCYRSFHAGMNPNVTRVREGNKEYIQNLLNQAHGSVLEHCTANFIFLHVSRVFTHELITHRVGMAKSQESLRFVRLDELDFWMPPEIASNPEAKQIFEDAIKDGEERQRELARIFDLDNPETPFTKKKQLTSAMRRIAPEGLATMVGWTGNFRTLRHVIETRTDPAAEREIRLVFGKVAEIAQQRWPHVFGDYTVTQEDGLPVYSSMYHKV